MKGKDQFLEKIRGQYEKLEDGFYYWFPAILIEALLR